MAVEYFMVFGYFLISMAIGAFCIGAAIDIWKTTKEGNANHSSVRISSLAATISLPLVILGITSTLFHLGRMDRFYNIIMEPGSWLTREAWSAGLFTACSFIYFLLWRRSATSQGPSRQRAIMETAATAQESSRQRVIIGAVGIILGMTAILSMSMIYSTVKAIPAWNTTLIFYMNLSNAFALGVFLLGLALAFDYSKAKAEGKPKILTQLRSFTGFGLLAIVLIGVTYFTYQAQLAMLPQVSGMVVKSTTGLLSARIILGILIPLVIIAYAWLNSIKKPSFMPIALVSSFVLVVAGDIMARMLHFLIAVQPPVIPPIF